MENTITIKNPINGQTLYTLKDPSSEDLSKVMNTAREMQPIIRAMTLNDRMAELDKVMQYVLEHGNFILDCRSL